MVITTNPLKKAGDFHMEKHGGICLQKSLVGFNVPTPRPTTKVQPWFFAQSLDIPYHSGQITATSFQSCSPQHVAEFREMGLQKLRRNLGWWNIVHPWRLTWNIIMEVWKIMFLSKWMICRFHVNLPWCNLARSMGRLYIYWVSMDWCRDVMVDGLEADGKTAG